MAIEAGDLVVIAFLSGIGSGFGTLIGQAIYRKVIEHPLKTFSAFDIKALRSEYTDSMKLLDALDTAKKKLKKAKEELEVQGDKL